MAAQAALLELAGWLAPALELGRQFALAWDAAKAREGLVDFDDLIARAARLLARSDLRDWIRYKLDRQFDHVLVDEAQDTNAAQWEIIEALTEDFASGQSARTGEVLRTLFVVGDTKQAIFGFQGTSPDNFRAALARFRKRLEEAEANAAQIRARARVPVLRDLGLGRSYRTAQAVLDVVDRTVEAIGPRELGLDETTVKHEGDAKRPGLVAAWPVVDAQAPARLAAQAEKGGEDWLPEPDRIMADRIAAQVRRWLDEGHPLAKGGGRLARAGDIMVLVRKRGGLAALIVARLHAAGVPVAGVDRLRLAAPLAVRDLMAALRFAAQPNDDLNLASLLVSPLVGWSQEDLLEHGYRGQSNFPLWRHLRDGANAATAPAIAQLKELLARADYQPPQALLHWMLVGPWRARARLLARLGAEAADPIDELVNASLAYATTDTPSLQGFIRWFDAGEGELKRDAGDAGGLVRVMTVHGSKGLEAPIVILADAAANPDNSRIGSLALEEEWPGMEEGEGRVVPIPAMPQAQRAGRLVEVEAAQAAEERKEHWRLLYVAMTRAEEALYVGGALGKRDKAPAPDSWYARVAPLLEDETADDPVWGELGPVRSSGSLPPFPASRADEPADPLPEIPDWARAPVGPEPRPPRPLAPSSVGVDEAADPPLPPDALRLAARRGTLIHRLLERLPDVPPLMRRERGEEWLEREASDLDGDVRDELLDSALAVLDHPDFAEIFAPGALAEIPLAATVGGQVVAGTADRLLVTDESVTVVDFKTARRPPTSLEDVPRSTLAQMAAYVAALEAIYPGHSVRAALLYTHTPQLIALPGETLAPLKAKLQADEENLAG